MRKTMTGKILFLFLVCGIEAFEADIVSNNNSWRNYAGSSPVLVETPVLSTGALKTPADAPVAPAGAEGAPAGPSTLPTGAGEAPFGAAEIFPGVPEPLSRKGSICSAAESKSVCSHSCRLSLGQFKEKNMQEECK